METYAAAVSSDVWTGEQRVEDAFANLRAFRLALRQSAVGLALWLMACLCLGFLYVHAVEPEYIASVRVVLKSRHIAVDGSEDVRQYHQIDLDGEQAETELRVIRSERVLRYAFDQLKLFGDPELQGGHSGLWSALSVFLHRFAAESPRPDLADEIYERFNSRVRTMQLGQSYVLDISYLGRSPGQAARVANAIASAYVRERLRASANVQPGTSNLTQRIAAVQGEIKAASEAVARGRVPSIDPVDADVRLLGAAVEPQVKAYPRLVPVLMLAAALSLASGFLVVGLLRNLHPSVASQRRLIRDLGVDLLNLVAVPDSRRDPPSNRLRFWRRPRGWRLTGLGSSGEAYGSLACPAGDGPRAIGIVSWAQGRSGEQAYDALEKLLAGAGRRVSRLDLARPGAVEAGDQEGEGEMAEHLQAVLARCLQAQTMIVLLPALESASDIGAVLPLLEATLLTVEAERTPLGEIAAGVRAVRATRTALAVALLDATDRRAV